jgi:WD40 repeat protein/tRNA A-37 threonylcarbamoyl transferase component Bud32
MNGDPDELVRHESRLDEAVAEYLLAAGAGQAPDRESFLARYPDLAAELTEFLEDRDQLAKLVRPGALAAGTPLRCCPHCHGPLETGAGGTTCGSCGAQVAPGLAAADPFPLARRVGRFELKAVLGRGAFGTVYKGWDPQMKRFVAVKALRKDALASAENVGRFDREGRVAAQLDHPGIVRVFDVGKADGIPYQVSEFVPGRTLAGLIRDDRPAPPAAAALVAAVADALHHAHQKQVFHRDVKPSNVLLKEDRVPLLTDFGLAFWDVGEASLTEDGGILGTLAYMSPEQARGEDRVDRRTDVYSLGVILYELLTGAKPFVGNVRRVLHQIERDEPRPPRALDDRVPRDLETVCLKCLRKEPARRYASAADLADDLRRHLDGKPVRARPVGWLERLALWVKRNPALSASCGAAVALLAAMTVVAVAWAVHADRQADAIRRALEQSKLVTAETELDRGLAEADGGDVAAGMHWLARSLQTAPDHAEDLAWTIRVNQNAWRHHLVTLTDCVPPPPGKVLAFAPDGRAAWFVDTDRQTVRCWDLASARVVGPALAHPTREVESIAVSPDGRRVACGGRSFGVRVWDATTGKPEAAPDGPITVRGLTYFSDGRTLILGIDERTGGNRLETVLRAWDGTALHPLGVALAKTGPLAMATGPDGRTLFTVGESDTELRRWDVTERKLRDIPLHLVAPIRAITVSSDGRSVLTAGDDPVVRLWDIETGQLLAVLHHRHPVSAVAFGKDGKALRTAGLGDAIRVWITPTVQVASTAQSHQGGVRALAISPTGNLVATGADDRQVRLWNTTTGKWVAVGQPLPHTRPIWSMAFSPDEKLLATTTFMYGNPVDAGVQLWDLETGKPAMLLSHKANVHQIAFSHDGRWVATAGDDSNVWIWDVQTGQPAPPIPLRHGGSVLAAEFTLDDRILVTAGKDGLVQCWDVARGARLGAPMAHNDIVRAIAFHPSDAELLLTAGDDDDARLWNVKTGELTKRLSHGHLIWVATFAPDGRTVLTGGQDGITRVWDVAAGQEVKRALRHGGRVRAIAVSRSGRWAAIASDDGTARLWAIHSGRPIGPPSRHHPRAICALIDPGERWVVTAGEDKTARLQPAPIEFTGSTEKHILWVQVTTGAELDPRGDLRPLDPAAWRQRRAALRTFGDPPP